MLPDLSLESFKMLSSRFLRMVIYVLELQSSFSTTMFSRITTPQLLFWVIFLSLRNVVYFCFCVSSCLLCFFSFSNYGVNHLSDYIQRLYANVLTIYLTFITIRSPHIFDFTHCVAPYLMSYITFRFSNAYTLCVIAFNRLYVKRSYLVLLKDVKCKHGKLLNSIHMESRCSNDDINSIFYLMFTPNIAYHY